MIFTNKTHSNNLKKVLGTLLCSTVIAFGGITSSQAAQLEEIHFLIPGGAGGGWDGTARGTGEALTKSGLIKSASYQNMSGGGGGKAIAHMIETAKKQSGTLMVNSTPIVIRSLTKVFPQSFRDLTPIASIIADYGAFVVRKDSSYKDWNQVMDMYKKDPKKVKFAGGSAKGSLDHLVPAAAIKNGGGNPKLLRYIPYDAGGKAMAALLSGEAQFLSTGLGEALELAKAGEIRILAITAAERVKDAPDVSTLKEMGNDTVFANWRGFFGAPGLTKEQVKTFNDKLSAMYGTPEWETVRSRNGWVNLYQADSDFFKFLEKQEEVIGGLMKELGFM